MKLWHFSLWRRASRSDTSPKSTPGFCKAGSEAGRALRCAEPAPARPLPGGGGEPQDLQAPHPRSVPALRASRPRASSGGLLPSQAPGRSRAAGPMGKAWHLRPVCSRRSWRAAGLDRRPPAVCVGQARNTLRPLRERPALSQLPGGDFKHPEYCLRGPGQVVCATG